MFFDIVAFYILSPLIVAAAIMGILRIGPLKNDNLPTCLLFLSLGIIVAIMSHAELVNHKSNKRK